MTDTMLDRAALALLNVERRDAFLGPAASLDEASAPDHFRNLARAAIRAVREPSEAISRRSDWDEYAWRDTIDAILSEKPEDRP